MNLDKAQFYNGKYIRNIRISFYRNYQWNLTYNVAEWILRVIDVLKRNLEGWIDIQFNAVDCNATHSENFVLLKPGIFNAAVKILLSKNAFKPNRNKNKRNYQ